MEGRVTEIIKEAACSSIKLHVSAPGKVILHGEHSVVYGRLAVAASLGLRTHLDLVENISREGSGAVINLDFSDINLRMSIPIKELEMHALCEPLPLAQEAKYFQFERPDSINYEHFVKRIESYISGKGSIDSVGRSAVIAFLYLYSTMFYHSKVPLNSITVKITSQIQVSSGMGSSASFSVCIAAAFLEYIKRKYKEDQSIVQDSYKVLTECELKKFSMNELQFISAWALQAEKVMHGNPSGIDNTVCTFGSVVQYRKGCEPKPLSLNHKLRGFLINTNVPKNTRALVQKVAQLKNLLPTVIENTFDSMEIVSLKAIECLLKLSSLECGDKVDGLFSGEYNMLNTLFDVNQNLLRVLGVSHATIDQICEILVTHGLHGKITGAGGGGYVICLVPYAFNESKLKEAEDALLTEKYTCHLLELGGQGVMIQ